MPSAPATVPLRPTRGLKARLAVNHAWSGVVLIVLGVGGLMDHGGHGAWHRVVAGLAVASGTAVLVAIARELATFDPRHRAAVGWVEVLAGVMFVVEGLEHLKFTKLVQPALGYFLAGALSMAIGFNSSRFAGVRRLRLDDDGFALRLSPLRRFRAAWRDLESIAVEDRALRLHHAGGRRQRIDLSQLASRDEVVAALQLHGARHGVPVGELPPAAARVQQALRERGSAARVVTLDAPGRTAAEAARLLDCDVSLIVKSLVFRGSASGRALMALVSGADRVDEDRLAAAAGEPIGRAGPEFVLEHTGFAVGGVAPLGHPRPLSTWIDEDLLQHEAVWAAGGVPEAFVRLDPRELPALTRRTATGLR